MTTGPSKHATPPSEGEHRAISGYEPQYVLASEMALRAAKEGKLLGIRLIDPSAKTADDFQILTEARIDACQVKWEKQPSGFTFLNLKSLIAGLAEGRKGLREREPASRVVVHVVTNCPLSTHGKIKGEDGNEIGTFFDFWTELLEPNKAGRTPSNEAIERWKAPLTSLQKETGLGDQDFRDFIRDLNVDVNATLPTEQPDVIGFSRTAVELSDVEKVKAYLFKRVREAPANQPVEITTRELLVGAGLGDRLDLRNRHQFPRPSIVYQPIVTTRDEIAERLRTARTIIVRFVV